MKTRILILVIALFASLSIYAQKNKGSVEVLYFKAQLACCQAKSCNVLENDLKTIIQNNFSKKVKFKEIKLNEPKNDNLIKKYSARSQTVIVISTKKGKEKSLDLTNIINEYKKNSDLENFEKQIIEKIKSIM